MAFPHHENEIAQSEGATGKGGSCATGCTLRSICWWKARRCRSRSAISSALRDLFGKGYKPSALRFALASVPYRRQLNFTFDGLQQAASAVERLRNFSDRLKQGKFPRASSPEWPSASPGPRQDFDAGLSDDLNTAMALAAIYDLVREANIAMDKGEFRQGDVAAAQELLASFDRVFAVIDDNDAEKLQALGYARTRAAGCPTQKLKMAAQRQDARSRRDYAAADRIRKGACGPWYNS